MPRCKATPGIKFRRGDTSSEHPGLVFSQYLRDFEIWITPEQRERDKEQARRYAERRRKEHPEKQRSAMAKWMAKPENLEIKRKCYRNWHAKNPDKRRNITRRYLATPDGAIINRVRSRIAVALKQGHTKSAATLELIGCSIEQLRLHLEAQFLPGMSWENRDQWEIHHRIPLAYFDLSDPKQQKEAFNWKNQQPVWIADNREMSDKLDGELFRARDYRRMKQAKNIIPFKAA